MAFDWIDGLLLCAGFVCAVVVLVALRTVGLDPGEATVEIVGLAGVFGPLASRRALFGAPRLPEPRRGLVASVVSIVGLLATFAGTGVALLGGMRVADGFAAPPDFEAEAREAYADAAAEIDPILGRVGSPVTPEDEAARAAFARQSAAEARAHWEENHAARRSEGWVATSVALGLLGLGVAASRWRYGGQREPE